MLHVANLFLLLAPCLVPAQQVASVTPAQISAPRFWVQDLGPTSNISPAWIAEGVLLYGALESDTDWNGDGDQVDLVLHLYDFRTGVATNLGMAVRSIVVARDGRAIFRADEHAQGHTDLNGDGFITPVYFAVDLASLTLTNGMVRASGYTMAFLDGEWALLTDKVGNLTNFDADVYAWDLGSLAPPTNLGLVARGETTASTTASCALHQGFLLLPLQEHEYGDLNGDGDALDAVLHAHDAATGFRTNTALATSDVRAAGPYSAFAVAEEQQGADLNSDGDLTDQVVHVFDLAGGGVRNLELAVLTAGHSVPFGPDATLDRFVLHGQRLFLRVSELRQGTDLNGDGDAADSVLHVYDYVSQTVTSLGLAAFQLSASEDLLAFQVREDMQGTDLNGDGDEQDFVVHFHRFADGATWNTGLAASFVHADVPLRGSLALVAVDERSQELDLNKDGDESDEVAHVVDAANETVRNLGLAADEPSWSGPAVGLAGPESLRFAFLGSTTVHDTGRVATEVLPAHRRVVPFVQYEAGVDWNGNGAAYDFLLAAAHLGP